MAREGDPDPADTASPREPRLVRLRAALPSLAVVFAVTCILAVWAKIVGAVIREGGGGYLVDHVAIWAAAKLALAGTPALAYDTELLRAAQDLPPDTRPESLLLWLYPPHAFLLAAPLGKLSFSVSFLLFSTLSMLAWVWAIWRPAATFQEARLWLVAAPPLIYCVVTGQPSLLWMAGFVAALSALRDRREAKAGMILALLTMKPHFGILVPIALIAGGYWRTIAWGAGATALLLVAGTAVTGLDGWRGLFDAIAFQMTLVENDGKGVHRMLGVYPFLRALGVPNDAALSIKPFTLLLMAAIVAVVWRRGSPASFDARAAVLCFAAYLATPYAHFYDGLLLAAAALFWARALRAQGRFGRQPRMLIVAGGMASSLVLFAPGFPIALLITPIAAAALIWTLACVAAPPARPEHPATPPAASPG